MSRLQKPGGGEFTFYFGAASGSARKSLKQLEERDVMINYATQLNEPWEGIDRLFIDCGGYSFMMGMGEYETTNEDYLDYVERVDSDYYALRDYPCEPEVLEQHNRSVADHQRMTLNRHRDLLERHERRGIDATPVAVLQGWYVDEYLEAVDEYRDAGVLTDSIAVGSVCGRDAETEIRQITTAIADAVSSDTEIHGFGVKSAALRYPDVRRALSSADSNSYDQNARWRVVHERDGGRTWHDLALEYLKQRQSIVAHFEGKTSGGDEDTRQATLNGQWDGHREASSDGGGDEQLTLGTPTDGRTDSSQTSVGTNE